jgi:hypothetical protein
VGRLLIWLRLSGANKMFPAFATGNCLKFIAEFKNA